MFPEVHYSTQWRNLTKESRDTNLHLIIIPGLIVAHRVGGATAKVHMRLLSRRLNFPVDTPIEKLKKKNFNFWNFVSFSFGKFQEEEEEEESWCARRYLWLAAEGPKKWLRVIIKVNIGRQHVHIARDQVYNHLLLFLFLFFFSSSSCLWNLLALLDQEKSGSLRNDVLHSAHLHIWYFIIFF
jgi:hypothetical protein